MEEDGLTLGCAGSTMEVKSQPLLNSLLYTCLYTEHMVEAAP